MAINNCERIDRTELSIGNDYPAFGLFLCAFMVRLAMMMISDNYYGSQPMLKLITALHILSFPNLSENIFNQHPPLYLYSLAVSVGCGLEQVIAGRFLSVVAGSASVVLFYYFWKRVFGRGTALFSGMLLCCWPAHIVKSVVTLPEVITWVLIAGALLLMDKRVFWAALLVALACGFDYLAWIFVPILFLLLLLKEDVRGARKIRVAVLFAAITVLFPVVWSLIFRQCDPRESLFYKNAFSSASSVYLFVYQTMIRVRDFFKDQLKTGFPGFFIISMAGIFLKALQRKYQALVLVLALLSLISCAGIFRAEIDLFAPGGVLLSLLLIPFFVDAAGFFLTRLGRYREKAGCGIILALSAVMIVSAIRSRPLIPQEVKRVSSWLEKNASVRSIVLTEKDPPGYYSSIIMLSNLPQGNFLIVDSPAGQYDPGGQSGREKFLITANYGRGIYPDASWRKVAGFDSYGIFFKDASRPKQ